MTSADDSDAPADGRSTRWEAHRRTRRAELVEMAMNALREIGPNLGMDEYATYAGTSKTVLYRHFTDRAGLHEAIANAVDEMTLEAVGEAMAEQTSFQPRPLIRAAISAYVGLVEREPNLYAFMMTVWLQDMRTRPDWYDAPSTLVFVDQVSAMLAMSPGMQHFPQHMTEIWSQSILGALRAGVDIWISKGKQIPADQLVEGLTELVWHGASAAVRYTPKSP